MTPLWYIDTWAPRDGIAFASCYPPDDATNSTRRPDRTVSLRPPTWEVVDVRAATALRAERLPFQRGLFANADTPMGFDTLDELIEVVRRAYVAAGGDVDDGPEPTDDEPRPPPDEPHEEIADALDKLRDEASNLRDTARTAGAFRFVPHSKREHLARQLLARTNIRNTLDAAVVAVAEEVFLLFATRVASARTDRHRPSLCEWMTMMVRAGMLDPLAIPRMGAMPQFVIDWVKGLLRPWWYHPAYMEPRAWVSRRPSGMIHHVPMPARFFRRSPKERLVDALLHALASTTKWARVTDVYEVATLLLAVCSILAQQDGGWAYYSDPADRRQHLTLNALTWFLGELPGPLNNFDAQDAIDRFAAQETQR